MWSWVKQCVDMGNMWTWVKQHVDMGNTWTWVKQHVDMGNMLDTRHVTTRTCENDNMWI